MNVLTTPTLLETCPYSEFFWSVFSHIRTEYGEISFRIQSKFRKKWTRKTPNTDTFYAKLIQKLNFNKLDKSKLFTNEADWSVSCIWTVIFFYCTLNNLNHSMETQLYVCLSYRLFCNGKRLFWSFKARETHFLPSKWIMSIKPAHLACNHWRLVHIIFEPFSNCRN